MRQLAALIFIASLSVFSVYASAQDSAATAQPAAEESQPPGDTPEPDLLKGPQDKYVPPVFENLSKLYWAIGKLDLQNNADIDNYLLINECTIYQRYINNDIEWSKIRDAARQKIIKDIANFPTHFEIMVPLQLGRYDGEKQQFDIEQDSQIVSTTKLDFAMNYEREVCSKSGNIPNYPQNLILILRKPLTVKSVPASPELAEKVIEETGKRYKDLPKNLQMERYKRVAYLRLKVHVVQYKETVRIMSRYLRAVVFAVSEGYEIYADPQKTDLIYKLDFDTMKAKRVKKTASELPEEAQPQQPAAVPTPTPPAQ